MDAAGPAAARAAGSRVAQAAAGAQGRVSRGGYTRLQERLRQRGVHDPGAGQTVHALERRGLLVVTEDRVEHPAAGDVGRVLVEITRRGRAAARAGLGEPREPDPAPHLLSEWLWGVVARVAAAEPAGLEGRLGPLAGRSLFFIGVGYRAQAGGRPSRGLVDSVPVIAPGGTHVAEYRWRLTRLRQASRGGVPRRLPGALPARLNRRTGCSRG